MSVHYKFKSAVEYDTLPVDGLNISLADLKEAIVQQKRLGKGQPYDLQITNAETKEVYVDDKKLIPKNSSLIVARVPIDASQVKRSWENNKEATALILANPSNLMNTEDAAEAAEIDRKIKEVTDLTRMEGSEQDKINAMVAQSTMEYHPSKYVKLRASRMTGVVPSGYTCYKCNQTGHWVTMCPLNNQDLRKSTGIPTMFLEEIKDPKAPGVMITPMGKLVRLRAMSEAEEGKELKLPPTERPPPPEELECQLCKELLMDAVIIPCCTAAFCDECIRNHLLDSEDHVCPVCAKDSIGPDTLIPNRYLRIKVQQYLCGCFAADKRVDASSDGGESLSSVPLQVLQTRTPPRSPASPAHSESPAKIRISDKVLKSPSSQTTGSPMPDRTRTPPTVIVVKPVGNGDLESDEHVNELENASDEIHDAISDSEFVVQDEVLEQEEALPGVSEEKENIELTEESTPDEKQKKIKKKKAKRKNSRYDSEEEKEEKKKRKKDKSHKSQDKKLGAEKKSKRHSSELLKDVADLPDDKAALWDDSLALEKPVYEKDEIEEKKKKKKKSHTKNLLKDVEDDDEDDDKAEDKEKWKEETRDDSSHNRSRSSSGDKGKDSMAICGSIVPSFNPHVPPPNFVKSPPKGYQYPVTTLLPQVLPPVPVSGENTYMHYQPGLIADPLTEFEKHLREKDERNRKYHRYSRSRSKSRSPRFKRRVRSRSRQRSWSRSPSRSPSRTRGGILARSPRPDSRRRWSRSPPPRGHTYRSRSPSYARERSVSNRSLSLSRTPSPRTSPLHGIPVQPPHLPDPHIMSRPPPPIDYNNINRDFNRFPMGSLPQDQFLHQPPPYHPGAPAPAPWDQHQHTRYNQGRPENFRGNFRGRRGRGGFRHGENFNHRGQDFRHQDYRSQHMPEDRRGMQGPPGGGWEREGRQNFNTEVPRSDRGNRHYDEKRRYGESGEYDDIRSRRHEETHGQNIYSDEEEWRSYSDDGRKREDEQERRRYDTRRGRDDRKDDSDVDEYDDYKRSRKDVDRGYKDMDDSRQGRHDREGKHRSMSRRDSPREEDLHYRSKSYDSPGKSHKKTSPRDRREKEGDRREKDIDRRERDRESDRRERDSDRRYREGDRRERDSDKRDRDMDRRAKDIDRRDRDTDKSDYERKEKDYDRKDSSHKRDRDQERKVRDGDRRERETSKRERDSTLKDKSERDDLEDDKREKSYVSRWDHVQTRSRSDKEFEKAGKSQERERSPSHEEKEHKRKSKRKEEKDESHHMKEKGDAPTDSENPSKVEKKKHDKKKKKKEKRRASQASTEASQGEASGDEGEDKKKKKKREKKKKGKATAGEDGSEELTDTKVPANEEKSNNREQVETTDTGMSEAHVENENGKTPDLKQNDENLANLLPMPPLSKWERDEELNITPKGLLENKEPEEEKKVTVDILKRAENTIFSGRGLAPRKIFLDAQKQKEQKEEEEREKERSPTPEWDRLELREAKRRGPSIQITISSKTESQIGRPRGGRHQSPEHSEDKRYPLRSRRGDSDAKSERHSRIQKRSQSPSESHQSTVKTRRKSERDHSKDNKCEGHVEKKSDVNDEESITSLNNKKGKVTDDTGEGDDSTSVKEKDVEKEKSQISCNQDISHDMNNVAKSDLKSSVDVHDAKTSFSDDNLNEESRTLQKGIKRASSSSFDDLDVKKPKTEEQLSNDRFETSENASNVEMTSDVPEKESLPLKGEPEYGIPVLGENYVRVVNNPETVIQNINSNLVTVPLSSVRGEELELEDGEIPSGEEEFVPGSSTTEIVEPPLELRGSVHSEASDHSLKDSQKNRFSPIRVPSPKTESELKESLKVKEKTKKRKKRKRSSSSSSSNSSSSSSSSSSSEDEEIVKKKKKKKKKKKATAHSESSDDESHRKPKKKKKDKKKKKKKSKKKSDK